jgi:hypothetical protein
MGQETDVRKQETDVRKQETEIHAALRAGEMNRRTLSALRKPPGESRVRRFLKISCPFSVLSVFSVVNSLSLSLFLRALRVSVFSVLKEVYRFAESAKRAGQNLLAWM